MDVSESQARREVELARRLLREREEAHQREVESLREGQQEQIAQSNESHAENLAEVRKKFENQLEDSRNNFDKTAERFHDRFEKQLEDERRDSYDKYGRMASENARDRSRTAEIHNKQFKDYADTVKRSSDTQRAESDGRYDEVRDKFEHDRRQLKSAMDDKLDEVHDYDRKQLADMAVKSRDQIDTNIRRTADELEKTKLGADLRFKQVVKDQMAERDALKKSFDARENQLADEKSFAVATSSGKSAKTFEDYRKRLSDALIRATNDSNFISHQKEREAADRLALANQEHRAAEAQLASQFRKNENDLRHELASQKDRTAIKETLDERRHKQDVYLNNEAIRANADLSQEILKAGYNDQLHELDESHQKQAAEASQRIQKQLSENELHAIGERTEMQSAKNQELLRSNMMHNQEKHHLVREYENRQNALEDLKKRQIEDQSQHYSEAYLAAQKDSQKKIFERSREAQGEIFKTRTEMQNRTEELEAARHNDLDFAERGHHEKAQRLASNYKRSLVAQKEGFDETTEAFRYDAQLRNSKLLNDAEHDRRIQLLDLQMKNRAMASSFEANMNRMKDEHDAEIQKTRTENDKLVRDTLKKTKETLDTDRTLHNREIEAKDRQMQEKLKLQEESFKEQIERLKRTNELALKKS